MKYVVIEIERNQKVLRLLNKGTNRLDHLNISSKLFGDHNGVGFKGESSGTKTVFIKSVLLADSVDASNYKLVINLLQQKVSLLYNSLLQQVS